MNPFDELSIEESVRMRERKLPVEDILAFSAGPAKSQDVLRTAMAMGADRSSSKRARAIAWPAYKGNKDQNELLNI